jgi:hypothetical protein
LTFATKGRTKPVSPPLRNRFTLQLEFIAIMALGNKAFRVPHSAFYASAVFEMRLAATVQVNTAPVKLNAVRTFFIVRCADHHRIRTGDEREGLVTASPVMTKSRSPSWERDNDPVNGLVKPPRLDTRGFSPAGSSKIRCRSAKRRRISSHACHQRLRAARLLFFFVN